MIAARAGVEVALAGGAGLDEWGRWLHDRLERERVDLSLFELIPGKRTPLAAVAIDEHGDARYQIYGDRRRPSSTRWASASKRRSTGPAALFFGSNTLVSVEERTLTMHARELALERRLPVIFDPNLRLLRWRSHADAAASANACVPGALLVRANASEAALMTGEEDPERAALALLKAGARMVVITLGRNGAILRGELRADVPGVPVKVAARSAPATS